MENIVESFKLYFVNVFKDHYADFDGRARRKEFWMFVLFNMIVSIVLGKISFWLGNIYSLVALVPAIGLSIRRMHDVGKSGWFILIPIYNIILAATAGVEGENEYGQDPKAEELLG